MMPVAVAASAAIGMQHSWVIPLRQYRTRQEGVLPNSLPSRPMAMPSKLQRGGRSSFGVQEAVDDNGFPRNGSYRCGTKG